MFDKLVESAKNRGDKRAGRYFAITTAIYALALVALGIGTIIGFSPALAEEYNITAMLVPPVPSAPVVPVIAQRSTQAEAPRNIFAPPLKPITDILPPDEAAKIDLRPPASANDYARLIPCNGCTGKTGISGGANDGDPIPPKPEPKPKPDPTPTPEIKPPGTTKVSEGVLQGSAIRKPKPAYPAMAKATRASGPVQVVVTISEEGRVIEAYAASGHPLLRATAVETARQWVFTPTRLSNVPVKVQGVLTFNFVLE